MIIYERYITLYEYISEDTLSGGTNRRLKGRNLGANSVVLSHTQKFFNIN